MRLSHIHIITQICIAIILAGCGNAGGIKNQLPDEKIPVEEKTTSDPNTKQDVKNTSNIDPSGQEIQPLKIDTSAVIVDSTLSFPEYEMVVTKEKYNSHREKHSLEDLEFNPLIIYITKKENDSVVCRKIFEENQYVRTYSFKEKNINYISLSQYSGGSGFTSTIYKVDLSDQPSFENVFTYNELTFFTFSKDGTELLVLQGIWEMSESQGESHFSDHRYDVSIIDLLQPKKELILHGTTKQKYPSYDYETTTTHLIGKINKYEPVVFKKINLDKYATQ